MFPMSGSIFPEKMVTKSSDRFSIPPVPLNVKGKDHALVGLGSYIVNAQADCNGCHTLNPGVEYTVPGNPYLLSPPFSGTCA